MEVLPDSSDHRAGRPWLMTLLVLIFFVFPGAILAVVGSLGEHFVASLVCLGWAAIGAWALFRRWDRWGRESLDLLAVFALRVGKNTRLVN